MEDESKALLYCCHRRTPKFQCCLWAAHLGPVDKKIKPWTQRKLYIERERVLFNVAIWGVGFYLVDICRGWFVCPSTVGIPDIHRYTRNYTHEEYCPADPWLWVASEVPEWKAKSVVPAASHVWLAGGTHCLGLSQNIPKWEFPSCHSNCSQHDKPSRLRYHIFRHTHLPSGNLT